MRTAAREQAESGGIGVGGTGLEARVSAAFYTNVELSWDICGLTCILGCSFGLILARE